MNQELSVTNTEEVNAKKHLKYMEQRLSPDTLKDRHYPVEVSRLVTVQMGFSDIGWI